LYFIFEVPIAMLGHPVAQLVEALRYKPEVSISDGFTGTFH
jgi:hypothetical protein